MNAWLSFILGGRGVCGGLERFSHLRLCQKSAPGHHPTHLIFLSESLMVFNESIEFSIYSKWHLDECQMGGECQRRRERERETVQRLMAHTSLVGSTWMHDNHRDDGIGKVSLWTRVGKNVARTKLPQLYQLVTKPQVFCKIFPSFQCKNDTLEVWKTKDSWG